MNIMCNTHEQSPPPSLPQQLGASDVLDLPTLAAVVGRVLPVLTRKNKLPIAATGRKRRAGLAHAGSRARVAGALPPGVAGARSGWRCEIRRAHCCRLRGKIYR